MPLWKKTDVFVRLCVFACVRMYHCVCICLRVSVCACVVCVGVYGVILLLNHKSRYSL